MPAQGGSQYFSPGDRRFSGGQPTWSPLKKFGQAKEKISKAFRRLAEQVHESKTFLGDINSPRFEDAGQLQQKVIGIQEMLVRDHMKVVFFGRTSNGKSTMINALLHDKVLPTGIGHTTNCFCSVAGTDAKEGYLMLSDSEEKQSVESVQQLAHSLSADQLDSSNLVSVYWPKDKCDLLNEDVVLVDSPGIDMDPDMDKWIKTHCMDADVFVLVSNGESTLMQSEKKFFHRVSERLSKPNIFIINNRWDMSESDPDREMVEKVKSQHLRFASNFLVNDLKVANETTSKDRVFFVSAKEALAIRLSKAKGNSTEKLGLANNWQQRLVDFDTFERKLKGCLSSAAIHTKFEKHHQEGQRVLQALQETMKQAEEECVARNDEVSDKLQEVDQSATRLKDEEKRLHKDTLRRITESVASLDKRIASVVNDTNHQLVVVVKGYGEDFDPTHTDPYLQALCVKVDSEVFEEGSRKYVREITELHSKSSAEIAGDFRTTLGLSAEEIKRLVATMDFSAVTFLPSCVEMCKDFTPDLNFHFSLGLTTILDKWSIAPSAVNVLCSVTGNQYLLIGGALGIGYLVSRLVTWEIVLGLGLLVGSLYCYEKLTWTDRAKERTLKDQFKTHVSEKMKKHVNESRTSYHGMLSNDLKLQMSRWMDEVNRKKISLKESSAGLLKQSKQLMAWTQTAAKLRNALLIVGRDFEDFEERYLPVSSDEESENQVVTQVFS